MPKLKPDPPELFAFFNLTEDNVVKCATAKNLTTKELGEIVGSKIFQPERAEKFIEILSNLHLEGYVKMVFKGKDSYFKKTWKWRRKKMYTHPSLTFWGIVLAAIAIIIALLIR